MNVLNVFHNNCDLVLNHWTAYVQDAVTKYEQGMAEWKAKNNGLLADLKEAKKNQEKDLEKKIKEIKKGVIKANNDQEKHSVTEIQEQLNKAGDERRQAVNLWKTNFSERTRVKLTNFSNAKGSFSFNSELLSLKEWIRISESNTNDRDLELWGVFWDCLPDEYRNLEQFKVLDVKQYVPEDDEEWDDPVESPETVAQLEDLILENAAEGHRPPKLVWMVFWGIRISIDKFLSSYSKTISQAATKMFPDQHWLKRQMKQDFGLSKIDLLNYDFTENDETHKLKEELIGDLMWIWKKMKEQANNNIKPDSEGSVVLDDGLEQSHKPYEDMTHLNFTGNLDEDHKKFKAWKKWKKENKNMLKLKLDHGMSHTVTLVYQRMLYMYLMQMVLNHIKDWDMRPYDQDGRDLTDSELENKLMQNCKCITYAAPFPSSISVCSRFAVVL